MRAFDDGGADSGKDRAGSLRVQPPCCEQSILRHITVQELREALVSAEIIEDYPNDKYGPSCLVLGVTSRGRPLHIQCSYPSRPLVKIITVYEPELEQWTDYRVRKS